MENFKFGLFSIVGIGLAGLLLFWAITSIQTGSENKSSETIAALKSENEDLKKEVVLLKSDVSTLEAQIEAGKTTNPTPAPTEEKPAPPKPTPTTTTPYKNQALISEFDKLVKANAYLKEKSQGAGVGSVQKFLNVYNKTSNKVDNDYGASTKTAVAVFQKKEGLTADGEAGVGTFKKMIDWLKKQG